MFGSVMLDVAVSMVFIYLLLSMICSGINEIIMRALAMRSQLLKASMQKILADDSLREAFYNHPLIKGLETQPLPGYLKSLPEILSVFGADARLTCRPAYIPSHIFSLVMHQLAGVPAAVPSSAAPTTTAARGAAQTKRQQEILQSAKEKSANIAALDGLLTTLRVAQTAVYNAGAAVTAQLKQAVTDAKAALVKAANDNGHTIPAGLMTAFDNALAAVNGVNPGTPIPVNLTQALTDAKTAIIKAAIGPAHATLYSLITDYGTALTAVTAAGAAAPPNLHLALTDATSALIEAASGPAKRIIDSLGAGFASSTVELEKWFDDSMQSVTGWYKRNVQTFNIIIGLVLAAAFNVDTIMLTQFLWSNPAVRDQIVQAAEKELAKQEKESKKDSKAPDKDGKNDPKKANAAKADDKKDPPGDLAAVIKKLHAAELKKVGEKLTADKKTQDDELKKALEKLDKELTETLAKAKEADSQAALKKMAERSREAAKKTKAAEAEECLGKVKQELNGLTAKAKEPDLALVKKLEDHVLDAAKKAKSAHDADGMLAAHEKAMEGEDPFKRIRDLQTKLQGLGVPVGWNDERAGFSGWGGFFSKFFGLLITGMAVSLGAPFWFDLLKNLSSMRSSGKPPKTADEQAGAAGS